ncbi:MULTISPECIES: phosphate signaling complex protein PhoU [Flavobacteriaceae]|uniref:Phosphate-specific transport system accessory protein PhoU n=2 Tax=Flavobacteriaceae TaxID=49546 RepID=A0A4Y8ASS3_9FLAO|nr:MULTISPECIES: phosphate signaling complex protein PhoU [Flavobacteriaceae]TEW73696.1 phosphate signaling complex protein PhoU [Gramella jeungdoensis]GGK36812.1 phosphate transport system regulatory protein PhoU [Lutibacter litoralis]
MVQNAEHHRNLLNESGLEMLNLCISQIEKATEALLNNDGDLAEDVMNTETRINALDLKIENDCEKFIALYTPVAIDLRFIMAVLKINFDLERIGDHAYDISKYIVDFDKPIEPHLFKNLKFEKMYATIISMFENITIAYEEKDVKSARKVFKKDKILDKINAESFSIIEKEINKDNAIIDQTLLMFAIIKKFERVGDLIKNIAEEIIFYIDAEVIKHKRKK